MLKRRQRGKRFILGAVMGVPWHRAVLDWHARGEFTRDEIADEWTRIVSAKYPKVRYNVHDVERFLRMARVEEASEVAI